MSRIIFFDLDHKSVGEVRGNINRGYLLYGNAGISGESSTQMILGKTDALQKQIGFGRPVLIEHPYLPAWMGIIDPPWNARLPVTVTLYGAEYLLSLRTPDSSYLVDGTAAEIISIMVNEANSQGDLFVRMGDTSQSDSKTWQETITQKPVWEQIRAFCERTKTELTLRPIRDGERLYLYLDLNDATGIDTGYLLHDGEGANMQVTAATGTGKLTNRLLGVSSQNTSESRLTAGPYVDDNAAENYRLRSEVAQFRNISQLSTLEKLTQQKLEFLATPRLSLTANILLKDTTAAMSLRLGNWFVVHASRLYLPGGAQGWRGKMRITKFFFTESTNTASVTMTGFM